MLPVASNQTTRLMKEFHEDFNDDEFVRWVSGIDPDRTSVIPQKFVMETQDVIFRQKVGVN